MFLLTSKRMIDCVEECDIETHNQEISDVFVKLLNLENYKCAVLCKYQDIGHVNKKMRIDSVDLHDIEEVIQWGDIKNGVDLFADENDEYLVLIAYGQSYMLSNEWHEIVEAFKILPYDENKNFLDVVSYVKNGEGVKIAKNQF